MSQNEAIIKRQLHVCNCDPKTSVSQEHKSIDISSIRKLKVSPKRVEFVQLTGIFSLSRPCLFITKLAQKIHGVG